MPYSRRNLKKKGPKVSLSQNNGIKYRKGTDVKGPLKVAVIVVFYCVESLE